MCHNQTIPNGLYVLDDIVYVTIIEVESQKYMHIAWRMRYPLLEAERSIIGWVVRYQISSATYDGVLCAAASP